MRKFGFLTLAAAILGAGAALAIFMQPERVQYRESAKADYATAVARVAAIDPDSQQGLDLSDLVHLRALPPEIATKSGLTRLNLSNTDVTDIGPLAGLKNLKVLSMNNVPVQDISALSALRRLDNLSISKTWVFDLAPITGLAQLEQLNLSYTAVKSLEPVLRLQNIEQLTLYRSYAHDGSALHYATLVRDLPRVNNGSAYKTNYKPDWQYRMNIRFQRLKQSLGFSRSSSSWDWTA